MKLYVWTNFCENYAPGLAFAIAEDEETARELVRSSCPWFASDSWGDVTVLPIDEPIAFGIAGGD